MVTHKFAQIRLGTYFLDMNKLKGLQLLLKEQYHQAIPPNLPSDLAQFLHLFPEPQASRGPFPSWGYPEDREVVCGEPAGSLPRSLQHEKGVGTREEEFAIPASSKPGDGGRCLGLAHRQLKAQSQKPRSWKRQTGFAISC